MLLCRHLPLLYAAARSLRIGTLVSRHRAAVRVQSYPRGNWVGRAWASDRVNVRCWEVGLAIRSSRVSCLCFRELLASVAGDTKASASTSAHATAGSGDGEQRWRFWPRMSAAASLPARPPAAPALPPCCTRQSEPMLHALKAAARPARASWILHRRSRGSRAVIRRAWCTSALFRSSDSSNSLTSRRKNLFRKCRLGAECGRRFRRVQFSYWRGWPPLLATMRQPERAAAASRVKTQADHGSRIRVKI